MSLESQFILSLETVFAAFLCAVIGMDREREDHAAGLRTHMLVGVGSCLFTGLSIHAFPGSETARVAAQIVVGIGFLGAGIVIFERDTDELKNVTTAAGIWVAAAIGMAVGAGSWFLALCVTLLVWVILAIIKRLFPYKCRGKHYN
jgi:putative Mg2+ transporter-C (MgtC) family protein